MAEIICAHCGISFRDAANKRRYFKRINERGVDGEFVCAPSCDFDDEGNWDHPIVKALEADMEFLELVAELEANHE